MSVTHGPCSLFPHRTPPTSHVSYPPVCFCFKVIVHRKRKIDPLSTHHYADRGVGEVFDSTKHFRSFQVWTVFTPETPEVFCGLNTSPTPPSAEWSVENEWIFSQVSKMAISVIPEFLMFLPISTSWAARQSVSENAISCSPVPLWSPQTPRIPSFYMGKLDPTGNFTDKASTLQANGGKAAHGADWIFFSGGLAQQHKSLHLQKRGRRDLCPYIGTHAFY